MAQTRMSKCIISVRQADLLLTVEQRHIKWYNTLKTYIQVGIILVTFKLDQMLILLEVRDYRNKHHR